MQAPGHVDLAFRHACLAHTQEAVDILIHDRRIASIVKSAQTRGLVEIDAQAGLVTSGLMEPHIHFDKALTGDRVPTECLGDLRTRRGLEIAIEVARNIKRAFTVEDVRKRAIRAALMASRAETTALRTHVDVDSIVSLTGIRGVLEAREVCAGWIDIQIVAFPQKGIFRSVGAQHLMRQAIKLGADAVGGAPSLDDRPQDHVRAVFDLASEFGLPGDMHVDESDWREDFTLPLVIEAARQRRVPNVTVAHISSLSVQIDDVARSTIAAPAETEVHVVVNPIIVKFTRLRALLDAGISVIFGSDNLRDPFYTLGAANPLESALFACQIAALGTPQDIRRVFDAVSSNAARMLSFTSLLGVAEGPWRILLYSRRRHTRGSCPGSTASVIRAQGGISLPLDWLVNQRHPMINYHLLILCKRVSVTYKRVLNGRHHVNAETSARGQSGNRFLTMNEESACLRSHPNSVMN